MPVIVLSKSTPPSRQAMKKKVLGAMTGKISGLRYSFTRWKLKPLLEEVESAISRNCGEKEIDRLDAKFRNLAGHKQYVAFNELNLIQNKVFSECMLNLEEKNPRLVIAYLQEDMKYSPINLEFEPGNLAETIQLCSRSQDRLAMVPLTDTIRVNHKRKSLFYELFLHANELLNEGKGVSMETISGIRAGLREKGYNLPMEA